LNGVYQTPAQKLKHASSQEPLLRGGQSAWAMQSMLGPVHTLGNRTRRSVPAGGAGVPEGET
jgi:hypothetical protein